MTTASERIAAFCDNWNPGGTMDPDLIYSIWRTIDGNDFVLDLTISDLREVLNNADRTAE